MRSTLSVVADSRVQDWARAITEVESVILDGATAVRVNMAGQCSTLAAEFEHRIAPYLTSMAQHKLAAAALVRLLHIPLLDETRGEGFKVGWHVLACMARAANRHTRLEFFLDQEVREAAVDLIGGLHARSQHEASAPGAAPIDPEQVNAEIIILARAQDRFAVHYEPFWQQLRDVNIAELDHVAATAALLCTVHEQARDGRGANKDLVAPLAQRSIETLDIAPHRVVAMLSWLAVWAGTGALNGLAEKTQHKLFDGAMDVAHEIPDQQFAQFVQRVGAVAKACMSPDVRESLLPVLQHAIARTALQNAPQAATGGGIVGLADLGLLDDPAAQPELCAALRAELKNGVDELLLADLVAVQQAFMCEALIGNAEWDDTRNYVESVFIRKAGKIKSAELALSLLRPGAAAVAQGDAATSAAAQAIQRMLPVLTREALQDVVDCTKDYEHDAMRDLHAAAQETLSTTKLPEHSVLRLLPPSGVELIDHVVERVRVDKERVSAIVRKALARARALQPAEAQAVLLAAGLLKSELALQPVAKAVERAIAVKHLDPEVVMRLWAVLQALQQGCLSQFEELRQYVCIDKRSGAAHPHIQRLLEATPNALLALRREKWSRTMAQLVSATYALAELAKGIEHEKTMRAAVKMYDALHLAFDSAAPRMNTGIALRTFGVVSHLELQLPRAGNTAWLVRHTQEILPDVVYKTLPALLDSLYKVNAPLPSELLRKLTTKVLSSQHVLQHHEAVRMLERMVLLLPEGTDFTSIALALLQRTQRSKRALQDLARVAVALAYACVHGRREHIPGEVLQHIFVNLERLLPALLNVQHVYTADRIRTQVRFQCCVHAASWSPGLTRPRYVEALPCRFTEAT